MKIKPGIYFIARALRLPGLRRHWVYRSAVTGRFVSKAFAEQHPETTYRVRA